jgi:two-component system response regulator HydG
MVKKRILAVDDDIEILESIKAILESEGYVVETATRGAEALEKALKQSFDLALLDVKLPDIEGQKLLGRMSEIRPDMKKIMVTGYASTDNAIEALNSGANAYLTKPVDPEELLKVVGSKLKEQEEAKKMSEESVTEWLRMRVKNLEEEDE